MTIDKNIFDIIVDSKNNNIEFVAPDEVEDIADYIIYEYKKNDLKPNFFDLNCLLYYIQYFALQNNQIAFNDEFRVGAYIPQVLSLYYNIDQVYNKLNLTNQEVVIDCDIQNIVDSVIYNKGSLDTLNKIKEITALGSAYQYTKFKKGVNTTIPLDLIIKDNINMEDIRVKRK